MHISSVSVRFGLILEAYCRGNILYLNPLTKQVESVRRLGMLAEIITVCAAFCELLFIYENGHTGPVISCIFLCFNCVLHFMYLSWSQWYCNFLYF